MILVCDVILCVCENVTSEDMTNPGPYYRAPPSAAWVRVASSVLKKNIKKIKKKGGKGGSKIIGSLRPREGTAVTRARVCSRAQAGGGTQAADLCLCEAGLLIS